MTFPPMPSPPPADMWSLPPPEVVSLASGARLYLHRDHRLPLVSLRAQWPFGSAHDRPGQEGLAALTCAMMQESAGDRSALERAAALDRLAARFSIAAGPQWSTLSLDVHRDRLAAALALVSDSLFRPAFHADDFARVRDRHAASMLQGLDDNATVSAQVAPRLWFGASHPFGHAIYGLPESIAAVDVDQTRETWAQALAEAPPPLFFAAGDVDTDALVALLDREFPRAPGRTVATPVPAAAAPARRWAVASEGSEQTILRVVLPAPPGPSTERFALELARIALGGTFTSRLNQRLREEKGYTYGARMGLAMWSSVGSSVVQASVHRDATVPALEDTLALLDQAVQQGFTEVEVERARAQALQDLVDVAQSRAHLSYAYALEVEAGRDPAAIGSFGASIAAVHADDLHTAARRWWSPDRAAILLVGDPTSWASQAIDLVDPWGR